MAFDLSLGVMRAGSGSMSTQDIWFTIAGSATIDLNLLKKAVETAAIVRVHYDNRRYAICTEDHILTSFEIVPRYYANEKEALTPTGFGSTPSCWTMISSTSVNGNRNV